MVITLLSQLALTPIRSLHLRDDLSACGNTGSAQ